MSKPKECPKCHSQMTEGFILDSAVSSFGTGTSQQSEWKMGKPTLNFFGSLQGGSGIPITTYRCSACGYLESYA